MSEYATEQTWDGNWAAAYSDGHNNRGLRGRRLAHYAHAFADLAGDGHATRYALVHGAFFVAWDSGQLHGTVDGNWHLAA